MLLHSLTAQGLRDANELEMTALGPVVELPAGASGIAVLDALTFWAAALDPDACRELLPTLGLTMVPPGSAPDEVPPLLVENGLPVQVALADGKAAGLLLTAAEPCRVTVEVDLVLDPPMFGRLREHAVRSPMLVAALGQHPSVTVKVGWLFSRDRTLASITVHAVQIGETSFPMHEAERWLIELLGTIGRRVARLGVARSEADMGAWLAAYQLSASRELRDRFAACAQTLSGAPFHLDELSLIADKGCFYPSFTPSIYRARQLGLGAMDALELVALLMLERPDIVLADGSSVGFPGQAQLRAWLTELLAEDGAPIEQIFWMGAPA